MSMNGPGDMTSNANRGSPDGGFLDLLRAGARIAVVAGAVGSVGLTLRAGRSTPRLLLVLFVLWVLSPFVALAWQTWVASRCRFFPGGCLIAVQLVLRLASLPSYGGVFFLR